MSRANPLDLALDDFQPKRREEKPRPDREAIAQVAKDNGFLSRDPKTVEPREPREPREPSTPRRQRRFTTGRNQQINIKATPETVTRFNALADRLNLPAGALLEQAVEILEKKFQDD